MSEVQTPVPGSPEHGAAMIALAEKGGVRVTVRDKTGNVIPDQTPATGGEPSGDKPQRPAHIPEKFWNAEKDEVNVEALAKSYTELEKGRSKPAMADPAAPNGQSPAQPTAQATLDAAIAKAAAEYEAAQTFTDETFAALEAAGVPRAMAENYVAGLQAQSRMVEMEVYGAAGGKDQYVALQQWAATALSAEQVAAFNAAVTSGDLASTKGAVANLKALYDAHNGADPSTRIDRLGGSGNEPAAEMYQSKAEWIKDTSSPEYKRGDKAFHAKVDRKLAASMRAGIDLGF